MYNNEELLWPHFIKLDNIRKLPLQEQIKQYNRYINDLSAIRYFNTDYSNFNTNANTGGPTTSPTYIQVNSASICMGDGTGDACACNSETTVYFTGNFEAGTTIYSDLGLTTLYYDGVRPNINYNGDLFYVNFGASVLIADGSCP